MNKKLLAAFDAFANKDQNAATKLFREFFVESARSINRKMERQLNEFYEGDEEDSFEDEVEAPEEDHSDYDFADEDEGEDDFGADEDFGDEGDFGEETPTAEQWTEVKDAFAELEALMQELGADKDEDDFGDEDFGDEGEDSLEFGDEDESEDGDFEPEDEEEEGIQESYQLKPVKTPDMKEQGDVNTKSPVVKGVKGVNGVKGTDMEFKGANATGTNDKLDTKVPQYKEENNSNVEGSGKSIYKKAAPKKAKAPEGSENGQMILKDIRK